ncbi:MAG: hydroxymethylbilane synthase, partial [Candidatus Omnitrophica bacterium]|nr:hydroxymethylbilane synthase [Candidatus Omnitrophota bacterium]
MKKKRTPEIIRIASRASALALTQAEFVKNKLQRRLPGTKIHIVKIATSGDKDKSRKAFEKFPTGIFVKQIEESLLTGKADVAVHSLKDLPSADTKKLTIAAYVKRLTPNDVLISSQKGLKQLPTGASVGTGSLRRAAQIRI